MFLFKSRKSNDEYNQKEATKESVQNDYIRT